MGEVCTQKNWSGTKFATEPELARQYINSCWDARAANLGAFAFQRNTIIGLHREIQRGAAIEIAVAA